MTILIVPVWLAISTALLNQWSQDRKRSGMRLSEGEKIFAFLVPLTFVYLACHAVFLILVIIACSVLKPLTSPRR